MFISNALTYLMISFYSGIFYLFNLITLNSKNMFAIRKKKIWRSAKFIFFSRRWCISLNCALKRLSVQSKIVLRGKHDSATSSKQTSKVSKAVQIQNWQAYERSLIQRGDLTIWLSEDVIQSWYDHSLNQDGRPKFYSNIAIVTALPIRLIFKLPLRQTEGFLSSTFRLMNVGLSVTDHTTLSRRNQSLKTKLKRVGNPSINITS